MAQETAAAVGDGAARRMARGGGLNLVGALCSQSALFIIMSLLAWRLGAGDVGRYALCYALLSLLGLLSLAGLRSALTRFTAMYLADNDAGRLRGTIRLGLGLNLIGSTVIGVGLALAAPAVADIFDDPSMRSGIILVALTLPASTFEDAALATTQGWRSMKAFALIGLIFDPMFRLVLTAAALFLGFGLQGALIALLTASWTGAVIAGLTLRRWLSDVPKAPRVYEPRSLFSYSVVSWMSNLAGTGLIWTATLMLGAMASEEQVGTYTVATRLVTLAVFVMAPINAAFTPHIAHLSHTGDRVGMSTAYGSANRWIMRISMPAFILLLVYPEDLLTFFGEDFETGARVTMILAVGQMVSAAAGPCGTVLNMSGRVALTMVDNVGALAANIGLNLVLIPAYGIQGAALSWSVALTISNLAKAIQVRHLLGVRSAGAGWAKTFLAAVPAFAVAALLDTQIDGWLPAVLIGLQAILITFVGVLALLGIGAEDAALVRSALRRVGIKR